MRNTYLREGWWQIPTGPANTICDVPGVTVGHAALHEQGACTGVTAILPHGGDLYRRPVPAAASILNGFGKSLGLVQLMELGEIETPILLTNTFGVPACATALIRDAIAKNPGIGRKSATVNPLVLECNDGQVNDIQALHVDEALAREALANTGTAFGQGTVGAGSGMKTFGFSGGVGSASRGIALKEGAHFTLGALVLSNFGQQSDMRVFGDPVALRKPETPEDEDKGSIIIILATDAPMESRQLRRLCQRGGAALGRLGSYFGHQSGDIAVAFSTANAFDRDTADTHPASRLCESRMNAFFKAAVEATEEAILNALWHAEPHRGYDGSLLPSFRETMSSHVKAHAHPA
ncbi:P1 family peptidase [Nitratireductor pacificus]|uniref:Peptidase S58 DmpA n=1 Tax=Nitratireductor pacificus pht-3B TaxID=391937 RepID=K2MN19_9HYPH|nr:P1 family peptidase [Nitratireductor pacificus]EKF18627.1 peptidase S58 DmpA [Nitratireductor pacificus pht-3B]